MYFHEMTIYRAPQALLGTEVHIRPCSHGADLLILSGLPLAGRGRVQGYFKKGELVMANFENLGKKSSFWDAWWGTFGPYRLRTKLNGKMTVVATNFSVFMHLCKLDIWAVKHGCSLSGKPRGNLGGINLMSLLPVSYRNHTFTF